MTSPPRTSECVSGRRTLSWTESFCIVAGGAKLIIGFVRNARPRCPPERFVWSEPHSAIEDELVTSR